MVRYPRALDVDRDLLGVNEISVGELTGEEASRQYHQSAPAQDDVSGQCIPCHRQGAGSKTDGGMPQAKYSVMAELHGKASDSYCNRQHLSLFLLLSQVYLAQADDAMQRRPLVLGVLRELAACGCVWSIVGIGVRLIYFDQ